MITAAEIIKNGNVVFGTSGARGLVIDFSPEVCVAFTLAFLNSDTNYKRLAIAIDNRPSSPAIAAACITAANSIGVNIDYYGVIPTPALAYTSMADGIPAIMVTGSHIPFDRNGLKFYRPDGEISKADELAILTANVKVAELTVTDILPSVSTKAADAYLQRYTSLFSADLLEGKRIGIYEHSSAGRDLYAKLFSLLGAEVISLGRSDHFVPIDTEAVELADIKQAQQWREKYQLDTIFSTDGDGDRPLLADETGTYLRGDTLCLLAAKYLKIEALAVPVSCNSAIEACNQFDKVERTKIGSPYVIAAFDSLIKEYSYVAGFEANGGFILASDILVNGITLTSLPTRDALLPALAVLAYAKDQPISSLLSSLPSCYTSSDRLKNFSNEDSLSVLTNIEQNPQVFFDTLGLAGFSVTSIDKTDGLRLSCSNGEVVHLRPSGNAPELRCYAEASSPVRANSLVKKVLTCIKL